MDINQENIIPVYLFLGFLEAGKTAFIQETIGDPQFNEHDRILLLVFEEGFTEYDLTGHDEVTLHLIENQSDLQKEKLRALVDAVKPDRILIEYNGMWNLEKLFSDTPENWYLFQTVTVIDSATFLLYNTNMRALLAEKMRACDLLYFNRFQQEYDALEFHRLVRALNRRTLIYYEYTDGNVALDNLEDPLPYDIESDRFVVHDRDFALWFRDASDDPEKYNGKVVTIRVLVVQDERLPKHTVAVGREVMTCCAADIQFCCMAAHTKTVFPQPQQWAVITARMLVKRHLFRQQVVPELEILAATPADPPEEAVATFY
ncbi:MAG: GTPase [Oscillospiraceae bacterium]|nr:GTPase [Oscillospiraceae bacterium]